MPTTKPPETVDPNLLASLTVVSDELARHIATIATAMQALAASRLTRRTIVTLIHAESKVPKRSIELVLNNLTSLEALWLKPKNPRS